MNSIRNKLKTIGQESLTAPKPSLGEPRNWLREKEVIELYPIGASTVYDWRKKGIIKKWKKVSPMVTVYSRAELEELFNPDIVTNASVEEVTKVAPSVIKKRRKRIKPKASTLRKPLSSEDKVSRNNENMGYYARKQSMRKKRRVKIAETKELNSIGKNNKAFRKSKETLAGGK